VRARREGRYAHQKTTRRCLVIVLIVTTVAAAEKIAVLDNCDPTDPTWAPTGGCLLEEGDVTRNEFNDLLLSPLSLATVGHPSWRNEPSYLTIEVGDTVHARNKGGRGHTFTQVANFGGGHVPPLNTGLTPAPECALALARSTRQRWLRGATLKVTGFGVGLHRSHCCIHPWMRAAIRVTAE
jgi:plastocyanin